MKGEYVDAKSENSRHHHHTNNMFSKLHHSHHQHQHSHPHQFHPFAANPFQVNSRTECQTSDENADVDTATTPSNLSVGQKRQSSSSEPHLHPPISLSGDGATIEVVRRPRGRPPGSKNKPKPPVIITRDNDPAGAMSPYILEVPGGNDVVDAISRFCRRKNIGLCVLTGSGTVSNVTLRQPSTTPGATVTFHGRFDILSITATFLPPSASGPSSAMSAGFTISLAGPQGQIVGGIVAGALVAAGTVYVVAASFNNPSYHRLPAAEEEEDGAGGVSGGGDGQSPGGSGAGESGAHATTTGEGSGGMAMYGCHVAPSEVIWAPTARQPPPY